MAGVGDATEESYPHEEFSGLWLHGEEQEAPEVPLDGDLDPLAAEISASLREHHFEEEEEAPAEHFEASLKLATRLVAAPDGAMKAVAPPASQMPV